MITVDNLSFSYDGERCILSEISLNVQEGTCLVLCGNSGEGKTTFLKIISGLLKPNNGCVLIDEEKIYERKQSEISAIRNKKISFLSQHIKLVNSISVIDNVMLPMLCGKIKDIKTIKNRAKKSINYVGLTGYENRLPKELSGGQRRRVEIARAICQDSKYIIMDEPTNSLDDICVSEFCEISKKMITDGKTLIISTHDSRLEKIATSIVKIEKAKLNEIYDKA